MTRTYDAAVVGAGIVGLAHAYHLAKAGRRVVVCERDVRAQSASIRNFGMLWPIGQPAGERYNLARRSLAIWHDVLQASGLWHEQTGSLHVAYHDDEAAVLREFVASAASDSIHCQLLTPAQTSERCSSIRSEGLKLSLWSATETCVDPRQVVAELPGWLHKQYGVDFSFATTAIGWNRPTLTTSAGEIRAKQLVICAGVDFQTLFPAAFADCGIVPCKLQMMRTSAMGAGWRLGPMLAAGLTLCHYSAFAECRSLAALQQRFDAELPDYRRLGIHVLVSQNGQGELILGDSHEYGAAIEPFDKSLIDDLVLRYLATFLKIPGLQIAARWHGIYGKHPTKPWFVAVPAAGATIVTGVGGAGMTLSFGLAERTVAELAE